MELESLKENIRMELESLKETVRDLEGRLKQSECDEIQLILGQLAAEVDREIPQLVLNPIIGDHNIVGVGGLTKALKGKKPYGQVFKNEEQKAKAIACWDDLRKKLQWSDDLFLFMKALKKFRNPFAHPTIEKKAIERCKSKMPNPKKQMVERLWTIYSELSQQSA